MQDARIHRSKGGDGAPADAFAAQNPPPAGHSRLTAATVGVNRKTGDVLNRAGARWEPRLLANLYAAAAVEANDAHAPTASVVS